MRLRSCLSRSRRSQLYPTPLSRPQRLRRFAEGRLFGVELGRDGSVRVSGPTVLGNLRPTSNAECPTELTGIPEPSARLHEHALLPFLEDVRKERIAEVERIAAHIEMSLT